MSRVRTLGLVFTCIVAMHSIHSVAPATAAAQDETAVTVEAPRPRRRHDPTLMIVGYVAFGIGWVSNAGLGLLGGYQDRTCINLGSWGGCHYLEPGTSFRPEWDDFRAASLVPVIGPWLQLAAKPASDGDLWPAWLVVNGIIQGAGAIMMAVGIAIFAEGSEVAPDVALLPTAGPDQAGLTLFGSF